MKSKFKIKALIVFCICFCVGFVIFGCEKAGEKQEELTPVKEKSNSVANASAHTEKCETKNENLKEPMQETGLSKLKSKVKMFFSSLNVRQKYDKARENLFLLNDSEVAELLKLSIDDKQLACDLLSSILKTHGAMQCDTSKWTRIAQTKIAETILEFLSTNSPFDDVRYSARTMLVNHYFNMAQELPEYADEYEHAQSLLTTHDTLKKDLASGIPIDKAGDLDDFKLRKTVFDNNPEEFEKLNKKLQDKWKSAPKEEQWSRKESLLNSLTWVNIKPEFREKYLKDHLVAITDEEIDNCRCENDAKIIMDLKKKCGLPLPDTHDTLEEDLAAGLSYRRAGILDGHKLSDVIEKNDYNAIKELQEKLKHKWVSAPEKEDWHRKLNQFSLLWNPKLNADSRDKLLKNLFESMSDEEIEKYAGPNKDWIEKYKAKYNK